MKKETMPWLVKITKPPFIALAVLALMVINRRIVPLDLIFASKTVGAIITLLGFSLIIWAASLFKKVGTEILPAGKPSVLVIKGPFFYTRNPMYVGMTAVLIGAAVWIGTLLSFLGPMLFVGIINATFIPYEEKKMERIFGKKYLKYKNQVRRWV